MANELTIKIKHSGKTYDLTLNLNSTGKEFKQQVYSLTGIEPDKVKIVVKGGMLKDDQDLKKLGFKEGQTIMVIGSAGALPIAPPKPIVFMEDMTDVELAQAVSQPGGLQNLGNTCYMNSTVQVLRTIPELQTSLNSYTPTGSQQDGGVTVAIRDLYNSMSRTTEEFPPFQLLNGLRTLAPQFAERSPSSGQYAQQDAQEAWGAILNALKSNLKVPGGSDGFVERFMCGEMEQRLKSVEAPDEEETITRESFSDIKCNISSTTNYMISGINEGLVQQIEKNSPSLGRSAIYEQTSRISRLPTYLTINLVRFFWRRDINKKTKIMRKVKFPFSLDMIDLVTPTLKAQLLPLNDKLKEVEKDRRERIKIRLRAKINKLEAEDRERGGKKDRELGVMRDPELTRERMDEKEAEKKAAKDAAEAASTAGSSDAMAVDDDPEVPALPSTSEEGKGKGKEVLIQAGDLIDEATKRSEESALLRSLVAKELVDQVGVNVSALYELAAIVTHKGASANGGHYVGWSRVTSDTTIDDAQDPDKQEWYRYDDERVTKVSRERIMSLDGGGEDHTAYILLYAAKKLE